MTNNTVLTSLQTALSALRAMPPNKDVDNAIRTLEDLALREVADEIMGGLYALEYEPQHYLFRVTAEDFAAIAAAYMLEKGKSAGDLSRAELSSLFSTTCDYLNGDGMPWAEVIRIALDEAWPERLK